MDSAARDVAHAEFLETAFDVTVGINTCLEIIYAADLERLANEDAGPDETAPPAVGKAEADRLMRLSIVTLELLCRDAGNRIAATNQFAGSKSKAARFKS